VKLAIDSGNDGRSKSSRGQALVCTGYHLNAAVDSFVRLEEEGKMFTRWVQPQLVWTVLVLVSMVLLIAKARGAIISSFDIVIILCVLAAPLGGRLKGMLPYIRRFRYGELEVELNELKKTQSDQQEELNTAFRSLLATGLLTENELIQLRKIAGDEPFLVRPRPKLESELRRLAGLGFIRRKPGGSITRLMREPPHDVRSHLEITDAGRKFLEIREEFLKEVGDVPATAT
jgi:hypothetical protein